MAQPGPPQTRQSKPPAKPAPEDALHQLEPGGPIKPTRQGYENPGPTTNLRGVEPNTAMHRGEPNPHQHGTPGHIGGADHDPGKGQAGESHSLGLDGPRVPGRHSDLSEKKAPPVPKGIRR